MTQAEWKFDQVPDAGAVVTQGVMSGEPVVTIIHYSDDHSWAFLCADADMGNAMLVRMDEVLEKHPDLQNFADLEPGYMLFRESINDEWQKDIEPQDSEDDDGPSLQNPAEAEDENRIANDIAEYGCHVVLIPHFEGTPGWAFSVGLFERYGHPEIVVFGMSPENGHGLINYMMEQIQEGRTFADGDVADDLFEEEHSRAGFKGVDVRWFEAFLGTLVGHYGSTDVPVLQLFWSDQTGKLPFEDAFNRELRYLQPDLGATSIGDANVRDLLASMDFSIEEMQALDD